MHLYHVVMTFFVLPHMSAMDSEPKLGYTAVQLDPQSYTDENRSDPEFVSRYRTRMREFLYDAFLAVGIDTAQAFAESFFLADQETIDGIYIMTARFLLTPLAELSLKTEHHFNLSADFILNLCHSLPYAVCSYDLFKGLQGHKRAVAEVISSELFKFEESIMLADLEVHSIGSADSNDKNFRAKKTKKRKLSIKLSPQARASDSKCLVS